MTVPAPCDGSAACPATTHIHGCYRDRGECDQPQEHRAVTVPALDVLREHTPYDYLGPDPNDPVAGEKWGEIPEYVAALADLDALVQALTQQNKCAVCGGPILRHRDGCALARVTGEAR